MSDDFIDSIKKLGYWRINFQPVDEPAGLKLSECQELIAKNSVKLRGWYYPFYGHGDADNHGIANHNTFVEGWIDSGEFREFWRMYKSGQFLHYSAVQEDYMTPEVGGRFSGVNLEPGKYLSFVGSLNYYITEIVEFLVRLHRSGLYKSGVHVNISLNNTKGRQLYSSDPFRRLSYLRTTEENTIVYDRTFSAEELELSPRDLAIEPIVHFYELFNMPEISVDQVIKRDQETLYGYNRAG